MKEKKRLLLGAHVSIAGGFDQAIIRGASIGCTTLQIFTKSNRQWTAKKITEKEIELFHEAVKESSIHPVIAHSSYLINIGSPNSLVNEKSIKSLMEELQRCQDLGITYLVLHPGSGLDLPEKKCMQLIAQNLDMVFEAVPGNTMILLENMAGQGSVIGSTFSQLAKIINQSKFKKRLGVCFDTCHAFAAGYDLRTKGEYEKIWEEFDQTIGLEKLKTIHINDSKKELGSRVDRHETIGKGKLGMEAFRLLFNDERFFGIPKILETPKESLTDDRKNMDTLESLLSEKTKKILNF